MEKSSTNSGFLVKVLSIGAVLTVSYIASLFVQSVVDDRIAYQTTALETKLGDTSQILIHEKLPGFNENQVSVYRPVDRVLKYAILFISLTFLSFFLTEVIYKLRLHPIQYLLVGLGLAEFYLLLLAFMEHVGFMSAYIIASVMTTLLISLYSRFVLKSNKSSLLIGILLTVIYSYLFITLNLEVFALLSGALLLFIVLTLVMFVTRNLNWYDAFDYVKKSE
ncbi:MAG: inner membrane CreD family protein [bacterium]|nr:inner membrane CreD family protein [bacterium]